MSSISKVNEDLQRERGKASFDPEALTEFLYKGKERINRRRYLQNIVFQDKYLQSFKPSYNLSREETCDTCAKKAVYSIHLCNKLGIKNEHEQSIIFNAALPNESNPFMLHRAVFIPTIQQQGTMEQKHKFLEPARRYEIFGTYAQTELGHGTFIRGIETTATYDPATQEFILNSPTLTSMKYWPGMLGKSCNYTIVMAQLYTGGKCYGMHAFVVQLRSMEDHTLLPGVRTGDIGNKMGFIGVDNGWLMFDNYRVPRDAMLMKNAKVEKDGTYVPPANTKLTYGSMVLTRCILVRGAALTLAEGCTIATRYSAVRRQSEMTPGGPEPQILNYQTQQLKLLPLIAASYALVFAGQSLEKTHDRIRMNMDQGQLAEAQVLHALSCGLKAFASYTVSDGLDQLRKACGGHGYSHASGIPKLFAQITPACTYEGENTVLELQCGRFLIKCYAQVSSGKALPGMASFLSQQPSTRSGLTADCPLDGLIEAYEHASARLVKDAAMRVQSMIKRGTSKEEAQNQAGVSMIRAAKLFSRTFVVRGFAKELENPNIKPRVANVLTSLCTLNAVCGIHERLGDFMQDGYLLDHQATMVTEKMLSLLDELRDEAVTLVDAFDFPDQMLQSCLGKYDGNVYEALYKYAQESPLNEKDVLDTYETTLRPLMKGQTPQSRL